MYKLLIIEDDRGIAQAIAEHAGRYELEVLCIQDFSDIMTAFVQFAPHLVLLDVSLPFFDGYHWCAQIRKCSQVPIIFISSAAENMNIVMAMNLGADDYIAKPFDMSVLMAKIFAMLRRTYDFSAGSVMLEHRGAVLNTDDNTLIYEQKKIPLSKNEYRILLCLLQNKRKVVERETLMQRLWETDEFVDENTLTVNVNRLRKKLDTAGLSDFITTKFGVGYIIE